MYEVPQIYYGLTNFNVSTIFYISFYVIYFRYCVRIFNVVKNIIIYKILIKHKKDKVIVNNCNEIIVHDDIVCSKLTLDQYYKNIKNKLFNNTMQYKKCKVELLLDYDFDLMELPKQVIDNIIKNSNVSIKNSDRHLPHADISLNKLLWFMIENNFIITSDDNANIPQLFFDLDKKSLSHTYRMNINDFYSDAAKILNCENCKILHSTIRKMVNTINPINEKNKVEYYEKINNRNKVFLNQHGFSISDPIYYHYLDANKIKKNKYIYVNILWN